MARGDESTLIWTRPEPGTRRPKFTREQIASTALAIADTEGFAAVSMRRIASELGAGTMTLYYYVRTKDELVALMDDAIMAEVLIPAGEFPAHWHDALTEVALRTWDVLMRHPWALQSLQNAPVGPNGMRHFEQSLAALSGTHLAAKEKFDLLRAVDDLVHGNALRSAEMGATNDDEESLRFAESQLATGEFPHTQALFGGADPRAVLGGIIGGTSARDRFRQELAMLLDGAAHRLGL
jgi:AcrR family transcriptional regulator